MNATLQQQTMKALKFGIEIEVVAIDRAQIAAAVARVVGGAPYATGSRYEVRDRQGRTWRVEYDGSLPSVSGEIVSPILTYQDLDELQAIVRAVREAGGRASEATGVHVHVGAEGFNADALVRLIKIVHKQERLIEAAFQVRPSRLARYCRPIEEAFIARVERERISDLRKLQTAWYSASGSGPTRYDNSRYHSVNLNSYFVRQTIEFRLFNGSVHAGEIKTYVQFALALAAKALTSRAAKSARRQMNSESTKYDFRVFALGLGFVGPEFKSARFHMTKHLAGSAAWKGKRRDRVEAPAAAAASTTPATDRSPPPSDGGGEAPAAAA